MKKAFTTTVQNLYSGNRTCVRGFFENHWGSISRSAAAKPSGFRKWPSLGFFRRPASPSHGLSGEIGSAKRGGVVCAANNMGMSAADQVLNVVVGQHIERDGKLGPARRGAKKCLYSQFG